LILSVGSCVAQRNGPEPGPSPTVEVSLTDRSLLTDEPCASPCWYGLELGVSSREEALAIAGSLPFVDSTEVSASPDGYWDVQRQENLPAELFRFGCREPAQTCAALVFVDGVLTRIYVFPNYPLRFDEVTEHLGVPDYVQIRPYHGGASPFCSVALVWQSRGVIVGFDTADPFPKPGELRVRCSDIRGGVGIDAGLPVQSIFYGLPTDNSFATLPDPGGDFPWTGFGEP